LVARILVVDDDAAVRSVTRRCLALDGHDVDEATTGREALKQYRAKPVDLVITDLYMPDMDGLEFIRRLVQEFVGTKVIAISGGAAMVGDALRKPTDALAIAARLGATATLAKPFTVAELRGVVKRALGEREGPA
jgi:CheY-like chemotaxis protein